MEAQGGKSQRQGAAASARKGVAGQPQVAVAKQSSRLMRKTISDDTSATSEKVGEFCSTAPSVSKKKSPLLFLARGIKPGSSKKKDHTRLRVDLSPIDDSVFDQKSPSIPSTPQTPPVVSSFGFQPTKSKPGPIAENPSKPVQSTHVKPHRRSTLSRVLSKCRPKIPKSLSSPAGVSVVTMDQSSELNSPSSVDDSSFSSYATPLEAASSSGYSTPMMFESGLGTPETSQSLTESLVEEAPNDGDDDGDETDVEAPERTVGKYPAEDDSRTRIEPKWTARIFGTAPLASSESSLSSKLTWDQTSLSSGQVMRDDSKEEVNSGRLMSTRPSYSLPRTKEQTSKNQSATTGQRSWPVPAAPLEATAAERTRPSTANRPTILFSSAKPVGVPPHVQLPELTDRSASTGEIRFPSNQLSGRSLSQPDTSREASKRFAGPQHNSLPPDTSKMTTSEQPPSLGSDGNGFPKNEHLYKVLVIGELGTGKTSIIKRYVHQFFSQHYRATIGVDFALKVVHWDQNTVIRLQLWDIAGQERFGNMTRVYYKEAVGAFIVFDVTRSHTFDSVIKWKQDLDSKVQLPDGSPIPCVLLANKCDQPKEGIAANSAKLDEFCKEKGFAGWYQTSAKDNINIDDAAKFLVKTILENDKWSNSPGDEDADKIDLSGKVTTPKKTKSGCC